MIKQISMREPRQNIDVLISSLLHSIIVQSCIIPVQMTGPVYIDAFIYYVLFILKNMHINFPLRAFKMADNMHSHTHTQTLNGPTSSTNLYSPFAIQPLK